jgi:alpha-mannosidase
LNQPLRHCILVQTLTFYHGLERIDCRISLLDWTGMRSREFRMALPLNVAADAQIAYEVPMGVVEVGKSEIAGSAADGPVYGRYIDGGYIPGPAYTDTCAEIHPRETLNFISASDAVSGVTLSTSVAVCDWVDPTSQPVPYPVLQPVLLASRKSCHWEGNWYPQPGDHHFHFSIFTHAPDWRHGWRAGIGANHALYAIVASPFEDAHLPPDRSYFDVVADNVMITTIKKAEDADAIIARCVEMEGKDIEVELSLAFPVNGVQQTNIIERDGIVLPLSGDRVTLAIGHHAIETFKLDV